VEIIVNDETRLITEGTTLAELLAEMQFQPKFVAVERNLKLVPRAEHKECVLQAGDRLEVVTLVGGG